MDTPPTDPISPAPADEPKPAAGAAAKAAGKPKAGGKAAKAGAARGPGRPSKREQRARQLAESFAMIQGGALMAALAASPDSIDLSTGSARRGTLARDVELFPAEQLAQALANLADRNAKVAATLDRMLSVGGNAELLMVALSFAYAVADNHGLTGKPLTVATDAAAA